MDIAFLLDSSSSIGKNNYQEMKTFINEVITHFHISPTGNKPAKTGDDRIVTF